MADTSYGEIDGFLDSNAAPKCAKNLVRALSNGSSKRMTETSFQNSADAAALFGLGLAQFNPETGVVSLTDHARSMIQ